MCCFACRTALHGAHGCAALPNNPGNPAMFDWGTYVNGGRPDPTWCVPFILLHRCRMRLTHCISALVLFVQE